MDSRSVPPSTPGGNIPPANNPEQAEAWLRTLPEDEPEETAWQLSRYLRDHADVRPDFLGHLVDLATGPADDCLRRLGACYGDAPPPLSGAPQRAADAAVELLGAMAGIRLALARQAAERRWWRGAGHSLGPHLHQYLSVATRLLEICHATHRDLPGGFWATTHDAYRIALAFEIEAVRHDGLVGSIGELYLGLLLEALADPYHLSPPERLAVRGLIARHAHLARLAPADDAPCGGSYGVRFGTDAPPRPLAWKEDAVEDCDLILDSTGLARALALLANRLEHGPRPAVEELPQSLSAATYLALLRRLKLKWGASVQRFAPRQEPRQRPLGDAQFGFTAAYRVIAETTGDPEAGPETRGPAAIRTALSAEILNESREGVALLFPTPPAALTVGGLMSLRRPDAISPELGLVCWFKTTADHRLTAGIRLLRGQPSAVQLRRPPPGGTFFALLLLPPRGGGSVDIALLTPRRLARGEPLRVVDSDRRIEVVAHRESLADLEIYQCRYDTPA